MEEWKVEKNEGRKEIKNEGSNKGMKERWKNVR